MSDERGQVEAPVAPVPGGAPAPRMRTLLICDLADSTALVERLGDGPAAELIRRHDGVARDLLQRFRGREIDKTDGFLLLFDRPVEAVGFALAYQRALHSLGQDAKQPLRARVGIHVGEVVLWENSAAEIAAGAKPVEVEGLAKPVVARLMALALPGQIILSGVAFTIAQRAEKELEATAPLRWLTHGRYHFKGVPAPMLVHEVGEAGFAPLQAPPSNAKGVRDVPLWRKPGVLALEVIAVIAAVAIPLTLSLRAPPAIAFGERDWIVMGELRNLTGETLLDDSLETAFRISLEQSRHVNVLPDLKLRDALARMQRPPDTAIDRAVASEIALREGARAVILPTVAEVGGRVRVSAEVVDPHTQTTVYAESADGVGAVSTLDSIDRVTHELRAKLGEALSAIEQDSAPLPKVTSANLDALRAYALGYKAYLRLDLQEAIGLYEQALQLDPGFAQATVGLARIQLNGDHLAEARRLLDRALQQADRLPARERLYVEAFSGVLEHRADAIDRWKSLIAVYPDFYPAYYNAALYQVERTNQTARALETARLGLSQRNPAYGQLNYFIGYLELANERYEPAEAALTEARKLGADGSGWVWARLYGARREYELAEAAVSRFKVTGLPVNDAYGLIAAASVAADRGDFDLTLHRLAEGRALAERASASHLLAFEIARLASREVQLASAEFLAELVPACEAAVLVARSDVATRPASAFALGWCSAAAARAGDPTRAASWLESATSSLEGLDHPVAEQALALAAAQRSLSSGRAAAAVDELEAIDDSEILFALRVLRIDALASAGELNAARREATSLANDRGAAYTELGMNHMLEPRNVIEANLARLRSAELAMDLGDPAAARADLAAFEAHWAKAVLPTPIAARITTLRRRLQPGDAAP